MNEILPGVFTWHWFSERHGYDFNGYFFRLPGGNVVVDPVALDERGLEVLRQEGVAHIVLTNRNHTRDTVRLRERTGAPVAIHPADAAHAAAQGVIAETHLAVGGRLGPFEILDASGKSPGEVALYDRARRLLLVGDLCVGRPRGALALLSEAVMDEPARLRASLARIAETVDAEIVLTGDGDPILAGGSDALRALVASFAA